MDGYDRRYRALRSVQRFLIEPPVRLEAAGPGTAR